MVRTPLLLSVLALSLSGCISILPDSGDLAPRLSLDAGEPDPTATPQMNSSLVIEDPNAEAVFNTFSVAVATSPYEYEYLAEAEWTDRVPVLFRLYMERRFENQNRFMAVGDRVELPRGDYALFTDIRSFHIDRTGGGQSAKVSFSARLVDHKGDTLGARVFSSSVPISGRNKAEAIRSLNSAVEQSVDQLIDWVMSAAEVAPQG